MTTPARYLTPDEMSVDQLVRHQRGERVENPDYAKARNAALRAAGLEPDPDTETPIEEMSVQDHVNRITRSR